MEKIIEWTYAYIAGTEIVEAKSGEMKRIINSEKAGEILLQKWVEIWATYKVDGPENPSITIAWISDDRFGFDAADSQEKVESLRPNRAAVWVYTWNDNTVWFYGYIHDFSKREDIENGFDLEFNSMKIRHRKIDNRVASETQDTSKSAMNLL